MTANFDQAISNIFKDNYKVEDLINFSSVITGRNKEDLLNNLLQIITVPAETAQDFFASLTSQTVGIAELNPKRRRSPGEMLIDKMKGISIPKHLKKLSELLPHKDAERHIKECLPLINSNEREWNLIIDEVAGIGTPYESEEGLMLLKVLASAYVDETDYAQAVARLVKAAKGLGAIAA